MNFRRYNDKTSTNLDLEHFLVEAYAKQIKELNSSTGTTSLLFKHNYKSPFNVYPSRLVHVQNELMRQSRINTSLTPVSTCTLLRNHYVKELQKIKNHPLHIFLF